MLLLRDDFPLLTDLVETEFGWCAFTWEADRLAGIAAGYDSPAAAIRASIPPGTSDPAVRGEIPRGASLARRGLPTEAARLAAAFAAYAQGERVEFPDVALSSLPTTPFASAVLAACRAIPYGEVRSYGEIAQIAGSPRASRAVGNVMRTNRYPILIPCHRVIAAGSKLGGYSSPQGLDLKRRLLAMESATANLGDPVGRG